MNLRGNLYLNILQVAGHTLRSIVQRRFQWKDLIDELYEFGVGGLSIVATCVTFVGIILILEYSFHIKIVIGNDSLIPSFAMIMLARELAPAVTALLLVSKLGASTAAELGAMKTTEQLDAYRLLGLNPIDMFVAPKTLAAAMSCLTLSIIALFLALIGGLVAAVAVLDFTVDTFLMNLFAFISWKDFVMCGTKSFLFGACIPIISASLGFRCRFGAEGVGLATTDAVVNCSIFIIMFDFVLTWAFSNWL